MIELPDKHTDLRKRSSRKASTADSIVMRLGYREPYRFDDLLGFFRARALSGIEVVDEKSYSRTVRIADQSGEYVEGWFSVEDDPEHASLIATLSDTLLPVVSQVVLRMRHQFDLDSDPGAIADGLASMKDFVRDAPVPGTRLPGCFDSFETTCRAVLGQQVTVKAANVIAGRIAKTYGHPIETGVEGLDRAWLTPEEVLSIPDIEAAFGELGVIRTRSGVIARIAKCIVDGSLNLTTAALFDKQMENLLAIKGIGPWTANYIAMRVLACPDAFLEKDVGVIHALPDMTSKERFALAEQWRPWRSYAVINLWNSLSE